MQSTRFDRMLLCALATALIALPVLAERGDDANRKSKNGKASGVIDGVEITLEYGRPNVNGREIWGGLVPWDKVWRTGANENTIVSFSTDVTVQGETLAAGTYGLHYIPGESEWGVVFSHNSTSWGSFFYDASEDALRVAVKPEEAPYREWLNYDFVDRQLDSTVLAMHWEELAVPVRISVPDVVDLYVSRIDDELRGSPGFIWQNWNGAAQFLLGRGERPEKALQWARAAASWGSWRTRGGASAPPRSRHSRSATSASASSRVSSSRARARPASARTTLSR